MKYSHTPKRLFLIYHYLIHLHRVASPRRINCCISMSLCYSWGHAFSVSFTSLQVSPYDLFIQCTNTQCGIFKRFINIAFNMAVSLTFPSLWSLKPRDSRNGGGAWKKIRRWPWNTWNFQTIGYTCSRVWVAILATWLLLISIHLDREDHIININCH